MILDAEQRQQLRKEVDKRARMRIGRVAPTDGWIAVTAASDMLGMKSANLRRKLVSLGVETRRDGNRRLVPAEALDLLREWD